MDKILYHLTFSTKEEIDIRINGKFVYAVNSIYDGKSPHIQCTKDLTKTSDVAYRNLTGTTSPYIIIFNNIIVYDKYIYYIKDKLISDVMFKGIMIIDTTSIISYDGPFGMYENIFIKARYVKELNECKYILIPKRFDINMLAGYLITDIQANNTYVTSDNRYITNVTELKREVNGKHTYIFVDNRMTYNGVPKILPKTYTLNSLIEKTDEINATLTDIAKDKIKCMSLSIASLSSILNKVTNPIKILTLYKDLCTFNDKIINYVKM